MKVQIKVLVAFFLATSVAMANRVVKVEVMTSNCEDCGMGPFGSLEVEVYSSAWSILAETEEPTVLTPIFWNRKEPEPMF